MKLEASGVALPAPVSIKVDDEIIWSSSTGRAADGTMIGDVVAEKKNISIEWQFLTAAQTKKITSNVKAGFFELKLEDGGEVITIKCYRGTTSKDEIGWLDDGVFYYRSVTSSMIQK